MISLRLTIALRWIWRGLFIVGLLTITGACSSNTQSYSSTAAPLKAVLPGQKIWKQNVSSFLFGTNDTYEWSNNNIQTQPAIQQSLRNGGFTLIRTFFPDKGSDADITKRVQTIEKSGAYCLGVITNISNVSFDEHLVSFLGSRCLLYEFGNEADWNGVPVQTYLQQWNAVIPLLRKINPSAKFIGPVNSYALGDHNFMENFLEGVKASGVLPDAISFHWYPCYQDTEADCLSNADTADQAVQSVRSLVQSILDEVLPIGITEWNFDSGNPPPAYGDNAQFMTKFTTIALQSMIQANVAFACQFDAASYAGYGHLDMFDVTTNAPKPQYYGITNIIKKYKPSAIQKPAASRAATK